jgi:hypothetical protein
VSGWTEDDARRAMQKANVPADQIDHEMKRNSKPDNLITRTATEHLEPAKRPRRKARQLEGQEQTFYFTWVNSSLEAEVAELIWHPANGGARSKGEAGKLKAQDVRAGVPDIVIDLSVGKYHGGRLELKVADGSASIAQVRRLIRYVELGFFARICVGWHELRDSTLEYLGRAA